MKKSRVNNKRTCIATRKQYNKDELIRIVKSKDGVIKIDINQNLEGRGAYILKNNSVVNDLIKKKLLHKVFKTPVEEKIYDELIKTIKEE